MDQPYAPHAHQDVGIHGKPLSQSYINQQPLTPSVTISKPRISHQKSGVITTIVKLPLGRDPANVRCPYCQQDIRTIVSYDAGCMAHAAAGILCLVGCWPCCLLPYCLDGFQEVSHECPKCRRHLGITKP